VVLIHGNAVTGDDWNASGICPSPSLFVGIGHSKAAVPLPASLAHYHAGTLLVLCPVWVESSRPERYQSKSSSCSRLLQGRSSAIGHVEASNREGIRGKRRDQMIDKCANRWWKAASCGEDEMDNPFLTLPVRKQPNQRAACQRLATRMVRQ